MYTLHVSVEAQLILNKFQVYKTLWSDYNHKKERKNAQNRKQNVQMSDNNPRDGFFYLQITLMIDPHNLVLLNL